MRLKTNRIAQLAFPAKTANKAKNWRALAPALVLALIVLPLGPLHAADDDDESGQSPSFLDGVGKSISNGFSSMGKKMGMGKPPGPPPAESPSGCPAIVVLDGTGAQRVMANADAGNQGLRYQYSIVEVARECHIDNNQMTIKVGVTGQVLLGPSGAPGGFKVPIRIAIVDERDQKPTLSKLYQIDASIPAGQTATPYALVADSLVIPFAAGKTASDYSIKIGIDGVKADKAEKPHRSGPSVAAAADPSLKPSPKSGDLGGGGGNNRAGSAMQR
ncbi:MAG: hypothetical protein ABSA13_00200 [Beijerinckiaceae bacterium]